MCVCATTKINRPSCEGGTSHTGEPGRAAKGTRAVGEEGVQLVHSTAQAATAAAAAAVVHRRQMRHAYHISNAQTFKRAK